jgi:hypothetical protein
VSEAITTVFTPLFGKPCWGVSRVHGSILSFQFGRPRLTIREPFVSSSPSAKVRRLSARRLIKPVGDWNLAVLACHWRVVAFGATLADDGCKLGEIASAIEAIDGQKLIGLKLDAGSRQTLFSFDLGATLETWPYEASTEDQWSVYMPDGRVLTYRADGRYSLGPGDEKADQHVWRPIEQDLRLSTAD